MRALPTTVNHADCSREVAWFCVLEEGLSRGSTTSMMGMWEASFTGL